MQLSRLVLAGAIAASSLLLGSAAGPESVAAESATPVVRGVSIFGRAFNPPVYRVPANSPIRWLNGDRVVHNITTVGEPPVAFAFTLPARAAGKTPCIDTATGQVTCPTFTGPALPPGRYSYVCTIHRRMAGTLIVSEGRTATVPSPRPPPPPPPTSPPPIRRAVSILGTDLSPRVVRVPQGGQLWFTNGSSEPHWLRTVTAEGAVIDPANPAPTFDTGMIQGAARPATAGTTDPASFPRSGTITIAANARPGRYGYVCLIHPNMAGTVQIDAVEPTT
ncbi:MAG TPA: hypothetical protein VGM69_18235 [Chloroflexota bacterium]